MGLFGSLKSWARTVGNDQRHAVFVQRLLIYERLQGRTRARCKDCYVTYRLHYLSLLLCGNEIASAHDHERTYPLGECNRLVKNEHTRQHTKNKAQTGQRIYERKWKHLQQPQPEQVSCHEEHYANQQPHIKQNLMADKIMRPSTKRQSVNSSIRIHIVS